MKLYTLLLLLSFQACCRHNPNALGVIILSENDDQYPEAKALCQNTSHVGMLENESEFYVCISTMTDASNRQFLNKD